MISVIWLLCSKQDFWLWFGDYHRMSGLYQEGWFICFLLSSTQYAPPTPPPPPHPSAPSHPHPWNLPMSPLNPFLMPVGFIFNVLYIIILNISLQLFRSWRSRKRSWTLTCASSQSHSYDMSRIICRGNYTVQALSFLFIYIIRDIS